MQQIGIVPFYSPDKIWQLYTPFINYLNKSTGTKWELKLYSSHEEIINGICSGDIAIALMGPVPFGRAYEKCRVKPIVVALAKNGNPFYRSIIITNDPAIRSVSELKGKKFALFKGSTAADVVPREMLADEGITMNNIIPVYLGGQDKIINALLNNEITAAGIKESLFEKIKGAHLKVLKTSAPLPNFVFCSRPAMPAKIEKEFVNALLTLKPASHPGDAKAVSDWDDEIKHGFVLPVNDYIQNSLELLMLFKKFTE